MFNPWWISVKSGGPSYPNPLSSPPRWCPWDLLRSVQMLKRERVECRKQREATAPIKSLVKLQPLFLSLRWKTCLRQNCSLGFSACSEGPAFAQNTDDDSIILLLYHLWLKQTLMVHFFLKRSRAMIYGLAAAIDGWKETSSLHYYHEFIARWRTWQIWITNLQQLCQNAYFIARVITWGYTQ